MSFWIKDKNGKRLRKAKKDGDIDSMGGLINALIEGYFKAADKEVPSVKKPIREAQEASGGSEEDAEGVDWRS